MALSPSLKEQPQFGVGQFDALAAFNGLLGLRFAWGTTFGLTLPDIDKALAQLNRGGTIGTVATGAGTLNLFGDAALTMLEQIGHGLTHTQAAAADKWVTEAWALDGIGATIERIAEDAVRTRKHITQRTAPAQIVRVVQPNVRAQLRPYAKRVAAAEARASAAEHQAAKLTERVAHLERAQGHPHAIALPGLPPRIGAIERELDRLKGRVGRIGKYAGIGAFLILLAKSLEKMGLNWVRCSNVKRYGKALCGMHPGLLGTLLADSLLIASVLSLRTLAHAALAAEDEIVGYVTRSVRELKDVVPVKEGGYTGVVDGRT